MLLGISSMGCPDSTLDEILTTAEDFKLDYVELRTLGGCMDLPAYLHEASVPESNRTDIRLLATPLCLLKTDEQGIDDFLRYAELANRLRVPYLRVFGDGGSQLGPELEKPTLQCAAEAIERLRARMEEAGWAAEILLETHDVFSSAKRCLDLNELLKTPVKILWDSFHTWNLGGENPSESWDQVEPWIEHIHHTDSYSPPGTAHTNESRFAPSGQGQYPCEELRSLLREKHFRGGLTLEWEKLWFPELPHVREVIGDFLRMFRS